MLWKLDIIMEVAFAIEARAYPRIISPVLFYHFFSASALWNFILLFIGNFAFFVEYSLFNNIINNDLSTLL